MSNISGFSSQVYAASSSAFNDRFADIKFTGKDSANAISTVSYRNAFTAFFGRMVSWVFDGSANKSLKDRYVADMTARANATGAGANEKAKFLEALSNLVDVNSRKPLSVYVVRDMQSALSDLSKTISKIDADRQVNELNDSVRELFTGSPLGKVGSAVNLIGKNAPAMLEDAFEALAKKLQGQINKAKHNKQLASHVPGLIEVQNAAYAARGLQSPAR